MAPHGNTPLTQLIYSGELGPRSYSLIYQTAMNAMVAIIGVIRFVPHHMLITATRGAH